MAEKVSGAYHNKSGSSVARVSPGRGRPYETVDFSGATSALSGNPFGSTRVEYGVNLEGGFGPVGIVQEGVPEPISFDLVYDLVKEKWLHDYVDNFNPKRTTKSVQPANVVVDMGITGELNIRDAWEACNVMVACLRTGIAEDNPGIEPLENQNQRLRQTVSLSALQWIRLKKPTLTKLADGELANLTDQISNKTLFETDGRVWVLQDGEGVGPTNPKWAVFDAENGTEIASGDITGAATAAISDAIMAGGYLVVCDGTDVHYARMKDLRSGTNTWGTATGSVAAISLGVAPDGRVYAGGSAGVIYRSTDKTPFAFEVFDNAVATTEAINSIVFPSSDLGWFGCGAGELLRYDSGVLTAVTVSGLSDAINVVNVPPQTPDELFLGTAGGEIYHSFDAQEVTPTFTTLVLPGGVQGSGSVTDIQFSNTFNGIPMFVTWNPAAGAGQIFHDRSGGAMGFDAFKLDETGTANVGLNSLAVVRPNLVMVSGAVVSSKAYVGRAIAT